MTILRNGRIWHGDHAGAGESPAHLAVRVLEHVRAKLGTTARQTIDWQDDRPESNGYVLPRLWPHVLFVKRGLSGLDLVECVAHECWHSHHALNGDVERSENESEAAKFGRQVRAEWASGGNTQ